MIGSSDESRDLKHLVNSTILNRSLRFRQRSTFYSKRIVVYIKHSAN